MLGGPLGRGRVAERAPEMIGDRAGGGASGGQHLTGPSVQQPATSRAEAFVEHLPDERVREPHPGTVEHSQACIDRLVQRVQHRAHRQFDDVREHRRVRVLTQHRRRRQAVVRGLPQPGQPPADDLLHARRWPETRPASRRMQPGQLLHEERIAVGALVHRVRDGHIGPAEHALHQHRRVRAIEATDGEPSDDRRESLQRCRGGRREVDRVVAAGQQQRTTQPGQHPGKELQQRQRCRVGQVDVLEDEQRRSRRRRPGKLLGHVGEHRRAPRRRRGGQGRGGIERLQRLPPRPVGEGLGFRTASPAHGAAGGLRSEGLGQRGLADPRVPEQEQTASPAGPGRAEQVDERAELPAPPDQVLDHPQIVGRNPPRWP